MDATDQTRVFKFGGTSLQDPDRIGRVVDLVVASREDGASPIVVVSALGGVTDRLLELADRAASGDADWSGALDRIEHRHREALARIEDEGERDGLTRRLDEALEELSDLARGISLVGECSPRSRDRVLSFGELLSASLVAAAFRTRGTPAEAHDARTFVTTDGNHGQAVVRRDETDRQIRERFSTAGEAVPVVTGFLGATPGGETTTLGRGGSDYTATLLGAALGVERVEIWTDVDGIMSADPRIVAGAFPLESITYDELLELSNFGAKVVAPSAVQPVRERGIPLVIRNTLNPRFGGTRVVPDPPTASGTPVRGISAIHRVVLVRLEGVERVGLMEVGERLFGGLRREGVDLLLYTQDSSGHSISFAVSPRHLERVRDVVRKQFDRERRAGLLGDPVVETRRSVLAVVGEGMRETPGVAGRLFGVLGEEGVNIHAIAQGSSERNISCVVTAGDEGRALQAVHDAFFRDPASVRLFVAGTGDVGSTFLDQLAGLDAPGGSPPAPRPVLAGVGRSTRAAVSDRGFAPENWREALSAGSEDPGYLVREAKRAPGARIFVDCTASAEVAGRYEELLEAGVAVVTANKLAFSDSIARWRALRGAAARGPGVWYSTTVGAGLPAIRTVARLRSAGDRVERIEGVLSGTLGYLLHAVREGRAFSEALAEAREKGLAEPDPRGDLRGHDVARKLLILGREAGFDLEPADVCVEPVVPESYLDDDSVDDFRAALPDLDAWFEERSRAARERGRELVPLGTVDGRGARVRLEEMPGEDPLVRIRGAENLVAIRSRRYGEHPIVIRGSGAGRAETAGQLLADVIEAATRLLERQEARRTPRIRDERNGDREER